MLKKKDQFELVLTTWNGDLHQDHRVVAEETRRAFMKTKTSILAYEVPGNCPGFTPQVFIPVTEEELQLKVEMLHMYESQVDRRGYFELHSAFYTLPRGILFLSAIPKKKNYYGYVSVLVMLTIGIMLFNQSITNIRWQNVLDWIRIGEVETPHSVFVELGSKLTDEYLSVKGRLT